MEGVVGGMNTYVCVFDSGRMYTTRTLRTIGSLRRSRPCYTSVHRCDEERRGRALHKQPGKALFGGSNLAKRQRDKDIIKTFNCREG